MRKRRINGKVNYLISVVCIRQKLQLACILFALFVKLSPNGLSFDSFLLESDSVSESFTLVSRLLMEVHFNRLLMFLGGCAILIFKITS